MKETVFTILGLVLGIAIAVGSGIYLKREWSDKESRKIYGVFFAVGVVITVGVLIKMLTLGF